MQFKLIVATDSNYGIGLDGSIPWYIKNDILNFTNITKNVNETNVVIMGRKTWDSIPSSNRPLKGRLNLILSNTLSIDNDTTKTFKNISSLLSFTNEYYQNNKKCEFFVIGGEDIYNTFLHNYEVSRIYRTKIYKNFNCDTFFPKINSGKSYYCLDSISEPLFFEHTIGDVTEEIKYQFCEYIPYRKPISIPICHNPGENQYLDLIKTVLEHGVVREDRTGTGTKSIFGCQMKFDLLNSFPLLTTKKMFSRGIIEELLWFLRGSTNSIELKDKNVHIWDGNSSRDTLDALGFLNKEEGDCGPVYGFNFRHFGATYKDCKANYDNQGYDQIQNVINLIKENPNSRRILISLWNPLDLDKVVLPPCHVLYQFYVSGDYLSCSMYQRSGDIGLGIPFNIASASLLTHLLAKICNKIPFELTHTIGDAHIYLNHIDALKKQLSRTPHPFPRLTINNRSQTKVEDFVLEDFIINGYECDPGIKMTMAI